MQLVDLLPAESPKKRVPHTSSLDYRAVIHATTRSASGGRINKQQKKRLRDDALAQLTLALDFLDD